MFEDKLVDQLQFTYGTLDGFKGKIKPCRQSGVKFLGINNHGIKFASLGSYIDFPYSADLAQQKFTLEAWVKPINVTWSDPHGNDDYGYVIIEQEQKDDTKWRSTSAVALLWSQNKKRFTFYSEDKTISTQGNFDAGAVYHVVVTKDDNHFVLYVDGQKQISCDAVPINYSTTQNWTIGSQSLRHRTERTGFSRTWPGEIYAIKFYNAPLSEKEVDKLYTVYKNNMEREQQERALSQCLVALDVSDNKQKAIDTIKNGVDVNFRHILPGQFGSMGTSLHCVLQWLRTKNADKTVEQNAITLIELLVEHGVDPNKIRPGAAGYAHPLHLAIDLHSSKIVELLLKAGAQSYAYSAPDGPLGKIHTSNAIEFARDRLNNAKDKASQAEFQQILELLNQYHEQAKPIHLQLVEANKLNKIAAKRLRERDEREKNAQLYQPSFNLSLAGQVKFSDYINKLPVDITSLEVMRCLSTSDMSYLSDALKKRQKICHVVLKQVGLTTEMFQKLLVPLRGLPLISLNISHNFLNHDKHCRKLIQQILLSSPYLQSLNLSYNELGEETVSGILIPLCQGRKLEYLDIRGFKLISNKIALNLLAALCINPSLQHLMLDSSSVHSLIADAIYYIIEKYKPGSENDLDKRIEIFDKVLNDFLDMQKSEVPELSDLDIFPHTTVNGQKVFSLSALVKDLKKQAESSEPLTFPSQMADSFSQGFFKPFSGDKGLPVGAKNNGKDEEKCLQQN